MPRKDLYHQEVRAALEKDGWTITDDPMQFVWEDKPYYPDLGAERLLAAQKDLEKIAVEIKSFVGQNFSFELYESLGQYDSYYYALQEIEPSRKVIIAVSHLAYDNFFI